MQRKSMHRRIVLAAMVIGWSAAVALALHRLGTYKATPGPATMPPAVWPSEATIKPAGGAATLLVFAHPHCPCTRATLAQLERALARVDGGAACTVLFIRPDGVEPGWERTDISEHASRIPGVVVAVDPEGREARRFNAQTSGHVLLYDRDGRLRFTGGITGLRGHEGANRGYDQLVACLDGQLVDVASQVVFGCPLFDRGAEPQLSASP